jgi:hypothetical protein
MLPDHREYAFGPWPIGLPVQVHGKAEDEFLHAMATLTLPAT